MNSLEKWTKYRGSLLQQIRRKNRNPNKFLSSACVRLPVPSRNTRDGAGSTKSDLKISWRLSRMLHANECEIHQLKQGLHSNVKIPKGMQCLRFPASHRYPALTANAGN